MVQADSPGRPASRMARDGAVILVGVALLAFAWMMNEHWLVTHFPPDYFPPYSWIENVVQVMRAILIAVGAGVIFFIGRKGGSALNRSGGWILPAVATILAITLALGAAEFILRSSGWQWVLPREMMREPLRLHDPVLGWIPKPSHTGYLVTGGRRIGYTTDAFSYREPNQERAPDFARPTIILAGESVMGGFGLTWDESVSARLSRLMKTQTADLSVGGYATDQIYLRLKSELRRFHRPVAVVFLFSPMLFRRNVEDGRPHLGPDLVLRPAVERSRLMELARWAIPYRGVEETDRAIQTTRAILSSVVRLAKSRGAIPIVLMPQFVPENPAERQIRLRVFGDNDLPVVSVGLDQHLRLSDDWHPNAEAARMMAVALARYLQPLINQPPLSTGSPR